VIILAEIKYISDAYIMQALQLTKELLLEIKKRNVTIVEERKQKRLSKSQLGTKRKEILANEI
jgi:hypothetical protein